MRPEQFVIVRPDRTLTTVRGIRLGEHFALTEDYCGEFVSITHLPTGCRVSRAPDVGRAMRVVEALLSCDFFDWSTDLAGWERAIAALSDEQRKQLEAARGAA